MRTQRTLTDVDSHLKRLRSRLKRTLNAIDKWERLRKRMVMGKVKTAPSPAPKVKLDFKTPAPFPVPFDDPIPTFLDRRPASLAATIDVDEIAKTLIRDEQAVIKKQRAAGRIAKMKAKQAGETRKMPLQGKAALDFINQN